MNEQKQATPAEELRRQFMDHSTPLTEAEMKIVNVERSSSLLVTMDTGLWTLFRRYDGGVWECLCGESWEPCYDQENELEAALQKYRRDNLLPPIEAEWGAKGRIEQLEAENKELRRKLARMNEMLNDVLDAGELP